MNQIEEAVEILKKGGVIAYPTETIYGLGADIFNRSAVKQIFKLKGRDFRKPLSIAVANLKTIKELTNLSSQQEKLVKKLLPGPITVLLPKKRIILDLITAQSKLVGIRFPDHQIAQQIIRRFSGPITATSANLSEALEVSRAEDVNLPVDLVVKGSCRYGKGSTVIDLEKNKIVRKGVDYPKLKEFGIIEKERI
jgi:L-threonylcarbamoyladenylate synthase